MSNHDNHRRGEGKRTENGPRWENSNPGAGCNSKHVAKSRADWKKIRNRSERRNGMATPKVRGGGHEVLPSTSTDEGGPEIG